MAVNERRPAIHQGKIVGASKVARDITEQKHVAEALRQAKEMLARSNEDLELRVRQRTEELYRLNAELARHGGRNGREHSKPDL